MMIVYSSPLWIVLLVIMVLIVIGALPTWPYSRAWGLYPTGVLLAVMFLLLVILFL